MSCGRRHGSRSTHEQIEVWLVCLAYKYSSDWINKIQNVKLNSTSKFLDGFQYWLYFEKFDVPITVCKYKKEKKRIFGYITLKNCGWIVDKIFREKQRRRYTSSLSVFFDKWHVYLHENVGNIFFGSFYEVDV